MSGRTGKRAAETGRAGGGDAAAREHAAARADAAADHSAADHTAAAADHTAAGHDRPGRDDLRGLSVDLVVVAAGESRRMEGVDKLRALIAGRPLLRWTLEAVSAAPEVERVVVVTAASAVAEVAAEAWLPAKVVAVVAGGTRRQESVAAGVHAVDGPPERVVLVHDAARPLVTPALVGLVARAAAAHGAAIPVVPVAETLKHVEHGIVAGTVDRAPLASAQTPQGFRRGLLETAYAEHLPDGPETWTDEAALLEACRIAVHAIPGEPMNLKVTLPDDLVRAEAFLVASAAPSEARAATRGGRRPRGSVAVVAEPSTGRVGFGTDSHPFGPGSPLALAGVTITGAPRLYGHSDGDVALHAVADALLGAAGLGDLGRQFPAGPETPTGISSREMLAAVVARVRDARLRPASVDLTIVASRPKLGARLDDMRSAVAELLGIDAAAVNVKASTGNLAGREGGGRGIAAEAVVSVAPIVDGADEASIDRTARR